MSTAGIRRVDEIEFFGSSEINRVSQLKDLQMKWRDELASVLGVVNYWKEKQSAGQLAEVY